jgi:prepilin-type N-terminal cleavage/methylation domain-containing protein
MRRSLSGFTLLEVLIALALALIIFSAMTTIYIRYGSYFASQTAAVSVGETAAISLNELSELVPQADTVVSSRTFSGTTYTTGATTLILELPSVSSTGDVIASTYDYVVFYVKNGILYRTMEIGSGSIRHAGTKLLTDKLGAVSFIYDNADVTQAKSVTADIYTQVPSGAEHAHLAQKLYLHNL